MVGNYKKKPSRDKAIESSRADKTWIFHVIIKQIPSFPLLCPQKPFLYVRKKERKLGRHTSHISFSQTITLRHAGLTPQRIVQSKSNTINCTWKQNENQSSSGAEVLLNNANYLLFYSTHKYARCFNCYTEARSLLQSNYTLNDGSRQVSRQSKSKQTDISKQSGQKDEIQCLHWHEMK